MAVLRGNQSEAVDVIATALTHSRCSSNCIERLFSALLDRAGIKRTSLNVSTLENEALLAQRQDLRVKENMKSFLLLGISLWYAEKKRRPLGATRQPKPQTITTAMLTLRSAPVSTDFWSAILKRKRGDSGETLSGSASGGNDSEKDDEEETCEVEEVDDYSDSFSDDGSSGESVVFDS
ncbi:hypothetical protein DIPPA_05913 [Diplonema papillatum]|nr:hypothetical protein DIPPA_05913 [Diplonema papillatum]